MVWFADDLTLPLRRHGWKARAATGLPTIQTLSGKHYFQEASAPEIATMAAEFSGRAQNDNFALIVDMLPPEYAPALDFASIRGWLRRWQ